MRGFADRRINTKTRQTRRSPTHNRHKVCAAGSWPCQTEQGVNLKGCETLSPNSFSDRPTLGIDPHRRNQPVGREITRCGQRFRSRSAAQPSLIKGCGVSGENDSQGMEPLRSPVRTSSLTTRSHFLRGFQIPKSSTHPRPGTFFKNDVNLMACRDAHLKRINQCQAVSWQAKEV